MSELKTMLATAQSFEKHMLTREERRSKKVAWSVAVCALLVVVLLIIALIVMLPLKTTLVKLYTVDGHNGCAEYVSEVKELGVTTEAAMAKAFAANYVRLREGYNYFSLQNDYDQVQLFSSDAVRADYLATFAGKDAPDKVYQDADYVVDTAVISNVISAATAPDMFATLRVKRTVRQVQNGSTREEFWDIRLTYHYLPHEKLTGAQHESNPLDFIVTSYQRDQELRKK